jgi:hypothetical protein
LLVFVVTRSFTSASSYPSSLAAITYAVGYASYSIWSADHFFLPVLRARA